MSSSLTKKEEKFLKDLTYMGSFGVFWNGLNDIDLDKIDKNIEKGCLLQLSVKTTKPQTTFTMLEKKKNGWKINYSNYLDKDKRYSLKEIVSLMRGLV